MLIGTVSYLALPSPLRWRCTIFGMAWLCKIIFKLHIFLWRDWTDSMANLWHRVSNFERHFVVRNQCDQIWQNLKIIWLFLEGLFCIWQYFEHWYFGLILCTYWANFNCCKWPKHWTNHLATLQITFPICWTITTPLPSYRTPSRESEYKEKSVQRNSMSLSLIGQWPNSGKGLFSNYKCSRKSS